MIGSDNAYSLEKAGNWGALFGLVSSWPSVQGKHWYLGNYYLLYKCDSLCCGGAYGRVLLLMLIKRLTYLFLAPSFHANIEQFCSELCSLGVILTRFVLL